MLGLKGRDIMTGFEGVIIGRTEWLTGCATVGLLPDLDKDGKVQDASWFDETRVELLEHVPAFVLLPPLSERAVGTAPARGHHRGERQRRRAAADTGGPHDTPQQAER